MPQYCRPSDVDAASFYSEDRRRKIRQIYYAMIAEYDAMVGKYVQLIDTLGITSNTVFICTSDHGDMNMEHQQFYKMVQYDARCSFGTKNCTRGSNVRIRADGGMEAQHACGQ
jgi:arylsulfatase A-like enzyme